MAVVSTAQQNSALTG